MSKRLNAIIRDEVLEQIDIIAKAENRTRSQMADILLGEAVAARTKEKSSGDKNSKEKTE